MEVLEKQRQQRLNEALEWLQFKSDIKVSKRELEVVRLLIKLHDRRKIAEELNISLATVNTHLNNVLEKLGFDNQLQLVAWYYRGKYGILEFIMTFLFLLRHV